MQFHVLWDFTLGRLANSFRRFEGS